MQSVKKRSRMRGFFHKITFFIKSEMFGEISMCQEKYWTVKNVPLKSLFWKFNFVACFNLWRSLFLKCLHVLLGHCGKSKQFVKVTFYFSPGPIKNVLYTRGKTENKVTPERRRVLKIWVFQYSVFIPRHNRCVQGLSGACRSDSCWDPWLSRDLFFPNPFPFSSFEKECFVEAVLLSTFGVQLKYLW